MPCIAQCKHKNKDCNQHTRPTSATTREKHKNTSTHNLIQQTPRRNTIERPNLPTLVVDLHYPTHSFAKHPHHHSGISCTCTQTIHAMEKYNKNHVVIAHYLTNNTPMFYTLLYITLPLTLTSYALLLNLTPLAPNNNNEATKSHHPSSTLMHISDPSHSTCPRSYTQFGHALAHATIGNMGVLSTPLHLYQCI